MHFKCNSNAVGVQLQKQEKTLQNETLRQKYRVAFFKTRQNKLKF